MTQSKPIEQMTREETIEKLAQSLRIPQREAEILYQNMVKNNG